MKLSEILSVVKDKVKLRNTAVCKVLLSTRESQDLDEICKYLCLTKSDAICRAIKYYHDDQCPCQTDQKGILDKAAEKRYLNGFEFSILVQNLVISENGYVIDTGNWENVNAEVALRLVEKIRKHPILWKLFFMVA